MIGTLMLLTLAGAPPPEPLAAERAAIFAGSAEERLNKEVCDDDERRVTRYCRDQVSFVFSNEMAHHAFRPYIDNVGGGYVGVGADHGLTFIAWARAELAWLMDYDPEVVRLNRVHRAFVLAAETPEQFRQLWRPQRAAAARRALRANLNGPFPRHFEVYERHRQEVFAHLRRRRRAGEVQPGHWLDAQETFDYVRAMYQAGRIRIVKGDLLKRRTLTGIGEVARQLEVPIRVVYLSNAEEFWTYPPQFRRNLRGLPMDERSVILRTRHDGTHAPKLDGRYAYAVQSGAHFQQGLADEAVTLVDHFLAGGRQTGEGLLLLGISEPAAVAPPAAPDERDASR